MKSDHMVKHLQTLGQGLLAFSVFKNAPAAALSAYLNSGGNAELVREGIDFNEKLKQRQQAIKSMAVHRSFTGQCK
ncbi:MAG: hypothetical protein QM808_16270 [Steroidobacteraceae bacterium]